MTQDDRAPDAQYWFARLDNKLDRIEDKLDGHGETLAEHGVRLDRVEDDIKILHDTNQESERHRHEERRHRSVLRWTTIGSLLVGFLGFAGALIALLAH
jgi:hypothetical protein